MAIANSKKLFFTPNLLPQAAIKFFGQPLVSGHFTPAISPPLTTSHIDHKVSVSFVVENSGIVRSLGASSGWEGVDHSLWDECG